MALIRKWFVTRPRFHVHFTPTYGSWINLVEGWFAELTNKRIPRGVFRSVKELESAIREYMDVHTRIRHPSSGPGLRIKSWIASLATPSAPWLSDPPDFCHEPLGQQTRSLSFMLARFLQKSSSREGVLAGSRYWIWYSTVTSTVLGA